MAEMLEPTRVELMVGWLVVQLAAHSVVLKVDPLAVTSECLKAAMTAEQKAAETAGKLAE